MPAGLNDTLPRLVNRFWAKVDKSESCWTWLAAKDPLGYGRFRVSTDDLRLAHRMAYTLLVGSIPEGLGLDHLCRNPSCVNPSHLEPVTHAENMRRAPWTAAHINAAKKRCPRGHLYSPQNTYVNPKGSRECRTCRHMAVRRFHERRRICQPV